MIVPILQVLSITPIWKQKWFFLFIFLFFWKQKCYTYIGENQSAVFWVKFHSFRLPRQTHDPTRTFVIVINHILQEIPKALFTFLFLNRTVQMKSYAEVNK